MEHFFLKKQRVHRSWVTLSLFLRPRGRLWDILERDQAQVPGPHPSKSVFASVRVCAWLGGQP